MTLGTIILFLFIGWIWAGVAAGRIAYAATGKRWVQAVAVVAVVWLPFWDVIPGWIMYQKAVRELGGVRIEKTAVVDGYLDRTRGVDCYDCWERLEEFRYEYVETEIQHGKPGSPTPTPGYYQFRLHLSAAPESCPSATTAVAANIGWYRPDSKYCLSVSRSDEPVSQYEYEWSTQGWVPMRGSWPIDVGWSRVRDLRSGITIAQAYRFRYVSWLGHIIGFPRWEYTRSETGRPLYFDLRDVLIPSMQIENNSGRRSNAEL
jgi:hypothetical protein